MVVVVVVVGAGCGGRGLEVVEVDEALDHAVGVLVCCCWAELG